MHPAVVLAIVLAAGGAIASYVRTRRIERGRGFLSSREVAEIASARATHGEAWDETENYLRRFRGKHDFVVLPNDQLHLIYGIVGEDLEEAVESILRTLHKRKQPRGTPAPRLLTVQDLASYIYSCPKSELIEGS
jgi:hypothetical protein